MKRSLLNISKKLIWGSSLAVDFSLWNNTSEQNVYLFLGYGPITKRIIKRLYSFEKPIIYLITDRSIDKTLPPSLKVYGPSEAMTLVKTVSFDIVVNSWRSLDSSDVLNRKQFLAELASFNQDLHFINLSTVAVYGDSKSVHTEVSAVNPINQYGRDKLELERYLDFVGLFLVQNLRIANVFGDIDLRDVINRIIEATINNSIITLTKPSMVFRDFIHIDVVVEFVHTLINVTPNLDSEIINVATGNSTSLVEVVEICNRIFGRNLDYSIIGARSDEIWESRLNTEKFKSRFKPHMDSIGVLLESYINELRK